MYFVCSPGTCGGTQLVHGRISRFTRCCTSPTATFSHFQLSFLLPKSHFLYSSSSFISFRFSTFFSVRFSMTVLFYVPVAGGISVAIRVNLRILVVALELMAEHAIFSFSFFRHLRVLLNGLQVEIKSVVELRQRTIEKIHHL